MTDAMVGAMADALAGREDTPGVARVDGRRCNGAKRGPKFKDPQDNRTCNVWVKFTPRQMASLEAAAAKDEKAPSQYIRHVMVGWLHDCFSDEEGVPDPCPPGADPWAD